MLLRPFVVTVLLIALFSTFAICEFYDEEIEAKKQCDPGDPWDPYEFLDCIHKKFGILDIKGRLNKNQLVEFFAEQSQTDPKKFEENAHKINFLKKYNFRKCWKSDWAITVEGIFYFFCFKLDEKAQDKEKESKKQCSSVDPYEFIDCVYKVFGILDRKGRLDKIELIKFYKEQSQKNPKRLKENLNRINVLKAYNFRKCLKVDWLVRPDGTLKMFCFKLNETPEVVLEIF
ncbi:unnamed protein product [Ceutorhynchus assimilis]|uniref:Uncharacterized protein n=1 Tax=Ceutorhynchus assimilis TaxID=467358 RepID=A0A9N9MIU4_9CUCU|nr:unnamed protein product [Ceutorhynchus assimilis]